MYAQTCPFKGNLQAENAPVQSVASGERRNKAPFWKNCLGGLVARLVQVLDTTNGLVKPTRFAGELASYSFEIRSHDFRSWHMRTDERLYGVSTDVTVPGLYFQLRRCTVC